MTHQRYRARTGRVAAAVLAAVLGLSTVAGSPAHAEPTPAEGVTQASAIPADQLAAMAAQAPYSAGAKRIQTVIVDSGATGFAGIAVRADRVELFWKGDLPTAVQAIVEQVRRDVKVTITAARFTRAELKARAAKVAATMRANRSGPIHSVEIPVDGSRVRAAVQPNAMSAMGAASAGRAVVKAAVQDDGSGVPVDVVESPRITAKCGPSTRYNDGWDGCTGASVSGGGAILEYDDAFRCTAGFGVKKNDSTFLLTAGHCGRPGSAFYNGNWSRGLGYVTEEHVYHDIMLFEVAATNKIWDGGARTNNFTKTVASWDWARAGEQVCQSGSTSGAICGIRNTDNFVYEYCPSNTGECYGDMILAERLNGGEAAMDGDSGGPVFTTTGDTQVIAKGTISGSGGPRLIYQDFGTAVRDFGIAPLT